MTIFTKTAVIAAGAFLATTLFLASCVATSSAKDLTKDGLNSYNLDYNQIVAAYDMDRFLSLYTENPLWIAPTDAPVAGLGVPRNTLAFLAAKNGILTHTADHTFFSKDGSQAVLIGRYDITIDAIGKKGNGTYLFVMQRDGEDWKIVVDMFNEHKPAA